MTKLWLWKNFVDGRPEYWAFDNPYPCHENGDPITLGEPCGYALVKESKQGRLDVSEQEVIAAIKRASSVAPEGELKSIQRHNGDGTLDEVFADPCEFHLEQMSATHWWIGVNAYDKFYHINLHSKGTIKASIEDEDRHDEDRHEPLPQVKR